ncbi:hypothetical protein AgCh_002154 [Apium graveolens]
MSMIFGPRQPRSLLLLCAVCVLVLIGFLGPSSSSDSEPGIVSARLDVYSNYRRLKEQTANDYLELRSLSSGAKQLKEFSLCGKEREDFVPCYNVSGNLLLGFKDGEEFDRHCEVSQERQRCLVRPPNNYKTPLSWPAGRDIIWNANVKITKDQFLSSGSMTKRLMLLEENQIAFHSDDGLIVDGVKDYSHQIAEMIGLTSDTEFRHAGVHRVLDIGCGFGSFGAHLLSLNILAVCMAAYELTGSQVQLSLERGLPAIIGNFISRQLPFPSLSYDMVHCAQCGISWDSKDGMFLIEVDRLLKPGGYFVLNSPAGRMQTSSVAQITSLTEKICWSLLAQEEDTFVWLKTADSQCYTSKLGAVPPCQDMHDVPSFYQSLAPCISEVHPEEFYEDLEYWRSALRNYWSLLTPLIFSDHPKRPGEEDPLPPYNMIRNVLDMNAHYGGLNAAFLESRISVWVMNVVPVGAHNTLPLILNQGFAGVYHDWCQPFPTYPRTYDMLHANGLLSRVDSAGCSLTDLLLEMDRILRPEGWVVLSDTLGPIEKARMLATQIRWEARVIDLQNGSDQRLLVCQKPFLRK